jgi:serine/threonine-protein kinase
MRGSTTSLWVATVILAQLYLAYFVYLAFSAKNLPDRVATKFGLRGRPRNYMSRRVYLLFIGILGVVIPFSGLISWVVSKAEPSGVNIPNRAYWFAPERIADTQNYFLAHSLWFACFCVAFMVGVHFLIVRANKQNPPKLSLPLLFLSLGFFLGAILIWSVAPSWHFKASA